MALLITNQGQSLSLASFLMLILAFCSSKAFCSRQLYGDNKITVVKHKEWMDEHGRAYSDAQEKEMRYNIFKNNVEFVQAFNKNKEGKKYTLSVNKFADKTNKERPMRNGYKRKERSGIMSNSLIAFPFRYGNVRSCWAFASVATVEGRNKLKTGNLISLSEQGLVDCDTSSYDHGCNGGNSNVAYDYMIKRNRSLATEDNYPYQAKDGGICKTTSVPVSGAITITGYENALLKAVANQLVSVANLPLISTQSNSSIIPVACGINLSHEVTAVGYGTSNDGTKYWLLKNSWGKDWGESGYMRLQRDVPAKEGLCWIAVEASYPTAG